MKAKMKIEGMHCESCAIDIKETLEESAGIKQAEVDYSGKTAIIDFDENTIEPAAISKIVRDLGYQTSLSESVN